MGAIEKEARYERRKGYLQKTVLSAVGIAGILAIGMVAPNTLQLLGGFGKHKRRFPEQARSALTRLAQKGYLVFEKNHRGTFARITASGVRALALEEEKASASIRTKRKWDKRYRMVMFDVPEKRKNVRDRLRRSMRESGFLLVQDSAWIYPYGCEDLIALIKADLRIGKDVLYVIVEKIENDAWIRKHFGLPLS